jgi:hypothetical protein
MREYADYAVCMIFFGDFVASLWEIAALRRSVDELAARP